MKPIIQVSLAASFTNATLPRLMLVNLKILGHTEAGRSAFNAGNCTQAALPFPTFLAYLISILYIKYNPC